MTSSKTTTIPITDTIVNTGYVLKISSVAALGGLLFGYDTAVIAGAIGFLQLKFSLSPAMTGWVASSAIWGCIGGVLIAGWLSDRIGRKRALILTAITFGISGVGSAIPNDLTTFIVARFAGGLAIGGVSMLAPLYISEIAPSTIRGRLVTLYQLAIVVGINLIYFINMKIAGSGDQLWNTETGWRWMLGSEAIPAVIFLVLLFLVPESPRWLMANGMDTRALAVLSDINGTAIGKSVKEEIRVSLSATRSQVAELFSRDMRKPFTIGIVLAFFSQITGINAIIYYAPEIFKSVGIGSDSAFAQTFLIGIVNTIFTLLALLLIDRQGRRKLLLVGTAGMIICLFGMGVCFSFDIAGIWLLILILGYIACFASSLGPIPWIIMSEIFPTKTRGKAMSVATVVLWIGVVVVTQFTPVLLEKAGGAWLFWIFTFNAVVFFIFALQNIPETRNLSLEEIEKKWKAES